jgi:sulfate adenylyltransferase
MGISGKVKMIEPYGGRLVGRVAKGAEREALLKKAASLRKVTVSPRSVSDCEMIAIGGFSPLEGFMGREEAESVLGGMSLGNGLIWGVPILLPVSAPDFSSVEAGEDAALADSSGRAIAIISISEKFSLDMDSYCTRLYGTSDPAHPGVKRAMELGGKFLAGKITLLNRPARGGIGEEHFQDPAQTRAEFEKRGWDKVVAFQTRNPIHRAHEYLVKCATENSCGALIHPIVGETKKDDIPEGVRMKCYNALLENYFSGEKTMLCALPASMHYAGPREAVHHMIMRRNYGCTHMIIGRDHAGVGSYYGTYDAQKLVDSLSGKLGILPVKFEHAFFCKECGNVATPKTCPHPESSRLHLSGTKVREMLRRGEEIPPEFSRPEVVKILSEWARSNE